MILTMQKQKIQNHFNQIYELNMRSKHSLLIGQNLVICQCIMTMPKTDTHIIRRSEILRAPKKILSDVCMLIWGKMWILQSNKVLSRFGAKIGTLKQGSSCSKWD